MSILEGSCANGYSGGRSWCSHSDDLDSHECCYYNLESTLLSCFHGFWWRLRTCLKMARAREPAWCPFLCHAVRHTPMSRYPWLAAMGHVEGAQGGFQQIAECLLSVYCHIFRINTPRALRDKVYVPKYRILTVIFQLGIIWGVWPSSILMMSRIIQGAE